MSLDYRTLSDYKEGRVISSKQLFHLFWSSLAWISCPKWWRRMTLISPLTPLPFWWLLYSTLCSMTSRSFGVLSDHDLWVSGIAWELFPWSWLVVWHLRPWCYDKSLFPQLLWTQFRIMTTVVIRNWWFRYALFDSQWNNPFVKSLFHPRKSFS